MASLELDDNRSTYQIRAFSQGTIQVNEKTFHQSIIITPDQLIENWARRILMS